MAAGSASAWPRHTRHGQGAPDMHSSTGSNPPAMGMKRHFSSMAMVGGFHWSRRSVIVWGGRGEGRGCAPAEVAAPGQAAEWRPCKQRQAWGSWGQQPGAAAGSSSSSNLEQPGGPPRGAHLEAARKQRKQKTPKPMAMAATSTHRVDCVHQGSSLEQGWSPVLPPQIYRRVTKSSYPWQHPPS